MIPYIPEKKSQAAVLEFATNCHQLANSNWNIKDRLLFIDRAYMREVDFTTEQAKAKLANRLGDPTKFQNIVLPVVLPQVENAVTYQQSVFLTGYPIFSVVSNPEFAEEAAQMDTLMGEHQVEAGWIPELQMCIRDGFKYNLMAAEVDWGRKVTYALQTDIGYGDGKQGKPEEVIWTGNKIRRMDLYNTAWDTRVAPRDIAEKGEFVYYNEVMGRTRFKQFVAELPVRFNIREALQSQTVAPVGTFNAQGNNNYYFPQLNPEALVDLSRFTTGTNWAAWGGYIKDEHRINYSNTYLVTTLYARIMPADFDFKGVPAQNTPQVWKFVLVNNQVLVYAERMTNAHNLIPVIFAQPLADGLNYQTKSLASNVVPFQEITTALSNSSIASRRRALSDRMLFDPSRVSAAAINNDSPTAKIPVRPSAYGRPLSEAVYVLPFRDDQFQINMQEIGTFSNLADQVSGLNRARQGQFVKGNKTKFEYADVMANASGRDQGTAMVLEADFFSKVKQILKSNILQYQEGGSVYNREEERMVNVDPVMLRKANLVFKVSDGLTPSDKLIDGDSLTAATQFLMGAPNIGVEYNIGDMFSYLMQSRGLKLATFKKSPEQVAYEQAVAQWQQAVVTLSEQLVKTGATPEQLQVALQAIPQPMPEQFSYVPGKPKLTPGAATTPNSPTIMAQVESKVQQAQQPQAPAPQTNGNAGQGAQ